MLTLLYKCMYYFASQVSESSGDTEQIRKLRSQVSEVERERDSLKHEVEELTFKLDEQLAHDHGMLKYKKKLACLSFLNRAELWYYSLANRIT